MGSERKACESLKGRIYKQRLETSGRLPTAKEHRAIERKAQEVAQTCINKERRR
jgi:hypothetical protein